MHMLLVRTERLKDVRSALSVRRGLYLRICHLAESPTKLCTRRSGTSFENFAVFCIQRLAAPDCEGEVESETGVKAYPAIFALEGV